MSSEDISIEEQSFEEIDKNNWGTHVESYYQKKRDKELKNDEFIEEEAKEAQRIQKELLSNIKVSDYAIDDDFAEMMKRAKEAPPEETEEFQLKKFNEMIQTTTKQIDGNEEERIQKIKEVYPNILKGIQLASKSSFEKKKEGGILGKVTEYRERIEMGLVLNTLCEMLCCGDNPNEHPVEERCETYRELFGKMNEMMKTIGKPTIQAFYDGTYDELIKEQQANEKMEEENEDEESDDEEMNGDEMENEFEEDDGENEEESDDEDDEDDKFEMSIDEDVMEDALGDLLSDDEAEQMKKRKELLKTEQPNVEAQDRATWLDGDDFDSDEMELEEKLLAELAASKQNQRKVNGEDDAEMKKINIEKMLPKSERKENKELNNKEKKGKKELSPEELERQLLKEKRKEIEEKRKIRLTHAEREEMDDHRPVNKVVKHGRGDTRGRKPQHAKKRIRRQYDRKMRRMEKAMPKAGKALNYKGEKKIDDKKISSVRLDY